jgi:transposase InsO family protein
MAATIRLSQPCHPPLVLKSDNGSPFISQLVRDLLIQWGVVLLLSPVRRPQYNGSIEAANGPMKVRTEHQAALAGRKACPGNAGGEWISGDLVGARDQANRLLRPRGPHGPTPHDLWQQRPPITDRQRRRFVAAVAHVRCQLGLTPRHEPALAQSEPTVISARPQAAGRSVCVTRARSTQGAVERSAIVNALSACGLLHIRRRPFTLPITL